MVLITPKGTDRDGLLNTPHCRTLEGAGIAQWLERRTRDWKVAGSNPCWNGGRILFSRVDFLCWLLFRYPFHPRVTTVARKKSRSFCQKCRWQVTAKHAYTLRMLFFIEPCFGIGHNLSLICQMTSEDIKHQLIRTLDARSCGCDHGTRRCVPRGALPHAPFPSGSCLGPVQPLPRGVAPGLQGAPLAAECWPWACCSPAASAGCAPMRPTWVQSSTD